MLLSLLLNIGLPEILGIAFIVLLLFGAKKIPELMRGLGKGLGEFKKGVKDIENEIKDSDEKRID